MSEPEKRQALSPEDLLRAVTKYVHKRFPRFSENNREDIIAFAVFEAHKASGCATKNPYAAQWARIRGACLTAQERLDSGHLIQGDGTSKDATNVWITSEPDEDSQFQWVGPETSDKFDDPAWCVEASEACLALNVLPQVEREALIAKAEKQTNKEIAQKLNMSEEGARKLIVRSMQKAREILLRMGYSDFEAKEIFSVLPFFCWKTGRLERYTY